MNGLADLFCVHCVFIDISHLCYLRYVCTMHHCHVSVLDSGGKPRWYVNDLCNNSH